MIVAAISREMALLHAHYLGRAPTMVKAVWSSDLVVVLGDVFTQSEKLIVDSGQFGELRASRQELANQIGRPSGH
jgi:uncharacterized protein YbcI